MKSNLLATFFCLMIFLLGTSNTFAQIKRNEKVGEERLNNNFGGDADTSTENFVMPTSNGKIQLMIDPLSYVFNGRVYGEIQCKLIDDKMLSFGYGYHGLKQNSTHSLLDQIDPRTGHVFRLGYSDHSSDYVYMRFDLMASSSKYLSYTDYTNFLTNTYYLNEFENTTFKMGAFINVGLHVPLPAKFFLDCMLGVGFMAGKTKTNLKNVYPNADPKESTSLYPFGPGIGYFDLEGACIQSGFRIGYVLAD
jgi:hypothetical protein